MSDIPSAAGANNHVMLVGNRDEYVSLRIGGMRFASSYHNQSDSQAVELLREHGQQASA